MVFASNSTAIHYIVSSKLGSAYFGGIIFICMHQVYITLRYIDKNRSFLCFTAEPNKIKSDRS